MFAEKGEGVLFSNNDGTVDKNYKLPKWANLNNYCNPRFFCHTFFRDKEIKSEFITLPQFLISELNKKCGLNYKELFRAQINITYYHPSQKPSFPHVDSGEPHDVAIYYINDTNGDTIIYGDNGEILQKVAPKKGRFLVFDGKYFHSATTPNDDSQRCIINFNLKKQAND